MRITGKYRDYYDALNSHDKSQQELHWHRELSFIRSLDKDNEIGSAIADAIKKINEKNELLYSKIYRSISSPFFNEETKYSSPNISIQFSYIYFCGKIIPYIQIKDSYRASECFYNTDSCIRAFEKKSPKLLEQTLEAHKRFFFSEDRKFSNAPFKEKIKMFFEQEVANKNCHEIHLINKNPVFIVDKSEPNETKKYTSESEKGDILVNGRLGDFNFSKILDPYLCFQEIEMYLGNNLVTVDQREEFNDKTKIVSHGFDLKASFRKEKTKNK